MRTKNLLLVSTLVAAAWLPVAGWAASDEESKTTYKYLEVIENGNDRWIYAQGHPILIEDAGDGATKISVVGKDESITHSGNIAVFGGSLEADVESSDITMTGGTVVNLIGGGRGTELNGKSGEEKTGSVGTVNIKVTGGKITNLLQSSSWYLGTVDKASIEVSGAEISIVELGGFSNGKTKTSITASLEECRTAVKDVTVNIDNAQIGIMGCGGGNGYDSHTGTSRVIVSNSTITKGLHGLYANGQADNIDAQFTNCTIKNEVNGTRNSFDMSVINRGRINQSASMRFSGCNFDLKAEGDAHVYTDLGAVEGWQSNNNGTEPMPKLNGNIQWSFENCTNVPQMTLSPYINGNLTVNGAEVLVKNFSNGHKSGTVSQDNPNYGEVGNEASTSEFTVPANKTWDFNNGLTMQGTTLKANGESVTLTVSGNLEVAGESSIAEGTEVTVAENGKLSNTGDMTVAGKMTVAEKAAVDNSGSLTVAENATVTNSGEISNSGEMNNNGTIDNTSGTIHVSNSGSFSGTEPTGNAVEYAPAPAVYYDLNLIKSEGAKLVSRHGKTRVKEGGSFTLSLELAEGYEGCQPTVYVKRGRFGEWKEQKVDEVSGYYQIRNVYTDIYVKVSGDGIYPVANEEIAAREAKAYSANGKLVVITPQPADVTVVTMAGAVVANEEVDGQREFANLPAGVYIVRIGETTEKVHIR